MSDRKILITGIFGFIGRYLAKALIDRGFKITGIDNAFRWQMADFNTIGLNISDIDFINGDITDENLIEELIARNDIVIHLAGISQVMTSIENPDICFQSNVIGTKNIVKYCAEFKKKLIFSSSREVYGTAQYLPVDLKHLLVPQNPYGASKIMGEALIRSYSESFGLDYIILRLANVYGVGDKERVIPIFINKALKNENISIFGDKKVIDFVYIKDVVNAFLTIIESGEFNKNIFNLGSGAPTTLEELANSIIMTTHSDSKIIRMQARKGEVDSYIADISQTNKILDWSPVYTLEKGLAEIFNDLK